MALIKKEKKGNKVEVLFQLPVEAFKNANTVKVVGDFNAWDVNQGIEMKQKENLFVAKTELAKGQQYQFRYVADNQHWENDYNADAYVYNEFSGVENSVVDCAVDLAKKTNTKATNGKATNGKAPKSVKASAAPKKAAKKTTPKAAKEASKTDLALITGVGPKLKKLFKEAKIPTIQELAKAPVSNIEAVIEAAGPRFKNLDAKELKKLAQEF